MTWNVLPAAPWASPSFTRRERVAQARAPAAVGLAVPVAGTGLAAGLVTGAAGVALTVIVLVGAAAGLLPLLPQPAASAAAHGSPAAARNRRSGGGDEVIGRFFLPRRLREPYDWYDALCLPAVGAPGEVTSQTCACSSPCPGPCPACRS